MNIYELYGIILGDGCIIYRPDLRVYSLEIVGNAEEEVEYYEKIKEFLENLTNCKVRLKIRFEKRGKSLRLFLYNKGFLDFLILVFNLGPRKTFSAKIPERFLSWQFSKHILRGVFETDGSFYFSRTGREKILNYPRIEIKTCSSELAKQIVLLLSSRGFTPHVRRCKSDKTFGVFISGIYAIEKWIKEIGFSSEKNKTKYCLWKRLGFYIPHSSLSDRQKCLRGTLGKQYSIEE